MTRHLTKTIIAGIVALLPIGGLVLSVALAEMTISGSWLDRQNYYFPGLGLIAVCILVYVVGLTVTTFLGRWIWRMVDVLLDRLPLIGALYQTLKQIVGYGEGKGAVFERVVLVPCAGIDGHEIGLVTGAVTAPDGQEKLVVFVPDAPSPTAGRLVMVDVEKAQSLDVRVSDALKTLVSVGKTPLTRSRRL